MAPFRLRPLTDDDVPMLLPWRNHADVRRFMFTQHEIGADEHRAFFDRALRDPTRAYYLGLDDETPVGLVTFRDIDPVQESASWGFYTRPGSPPGTGRRMLTLALDQAFVRDGLTKVSGEAFAFNRASIRLHLGLGFSVEGFLRSHRRCGGRRVDVVRMAMLEGHWTSEHKAWLARASEARSRSAGGDAPRSYRVDAHGGLAQLVVNHLTAGMGSVTSVHLDALRAATHVGTVELVLRRVANGAGQATFDIDIVDADGATLARGRADVIVAEGRA